MRMSHRSWILFVLVSLVAAGCAAPPAADAPAAATAPTAAPAASQERGGQEEFGPYEPVPNWPQPLPDGPDGVTHGGWTWGSVGAVFAESPDRIWIAQRGELPLPPGAKPWTPYAMLIPYLRSCSPLFQNLLCFLFPFHVIVVPNYLDKRIVRTPYCSS